MIKLIISDIDGTLVNQKKELSPNFWEVFKKIQAKNIQFGVASGRQMQSLQKLFQPIENQIVMVSDNGAFIRFKDEILFEKSLQLPDVSHIIKECEKLEEIAIVVCAKEKAFVKTSGEKLFDEVALYYPAIEQVVDFQGVTDIFKISIYDEKGVKNNSFQKLEQFSEEFNVVISGEKWLDITEKNINKGEAVAFLQEKWNISADETAVFGDQFNDEQMLGKAKFSYAMKNAPAEIKEIANFVTEFDNNNEGVLKTIDFLLTD